MILIKTVCELNQLRLGKISLTSHVLNKDCMKNSLVCKVSFILLLFIGASNGLSAQDTKNHKKVYSSFGGELIFSWADVTSNGVDANTITRFSPVLNIQHQLHLDMNEKLGFLTGVNIRNVGFIFDDPNAVSTRYKARSYTLGIPLAIKAGNMNGLFLFGGYELEFPFNFKEKKFVNEDKVDKNTSWFSNKTPTVYQTLFAGLQTRYGVQLKFKYYMTNFFNKDYSANDGAGNVIYPYRDINANVFYTSLSIQIY